MPNQQCQSTESIVVSCNNKHVLVLPKCSCMTGACDCAGCCGRYVANKLLETGDHDQLVKLVERVQGRFIICCVLVGCLKLQFNFLHNRTTGCFQSHPLLGWMALKTASYSVVQELQFQITNNQAVSQELLKFSIVFIGTPFLSFMTVICHTIHRAVVAFSPFLNRSLCNYHAYQLFYESWESHIKQFFIREKLSLISCSENQPSCS